MNICSSRTSRRLFTLMRACIALGFTGTATAQVSPTSVLIQFQGGGASLAQFKSEIGDVEIKPVPSLNAQLLKGAKPFDDEFLAKLRKDSRVGKVDAIQGDYRDLFSRSMTPAMLPPAAAANLARLREGRPGAQVSLVSLQAKDFTNEFLVVGMDVREGFKDSGSIKLNIAPGLDVTAVRTGVSRPANAASILWTANVSAAPESTSGARAATGDAALTVLGDEIVGRVTIGSDVYTISPLGGGAHAVVKQDEQTRDHPPPPPKYRT